MPTSPHEHAYFTTSYTVPPLTFFLLPPSSYYNHHVSKDREWVYHAKGEIVAVRYSHTDQWYRARVLGFMEEIVQVGLVL